MWQRIQTVYLLLAAVCCLVCLAMPLAEIVPEEMGVNSVFYNLLTITDDQVDVTIPGILCFSLLSSAVTCGVVSIFLYKNRKSQARLCAGAALLTLLWCAAYSMLFWMDMGGEPQPQFAACLPVVALIFFLLARHAILKDEALVRAADRIR